MPEVVNKVLKGRAVQNENRKNDTLSKQEVQTGNQTEDSVGILCHEWTPSISNLSQNGHLKFADKASNKWMDAKPVW